MINIMEIVDKIKEGVFNYTGNLALSEVITNNINISILNDADFCKKAGVDDISKCPGRAFYLTSEKAIYILQRQIYDAHDVHNMIHEMLHSYSDNSSIGKSGLEVSEYDENDKLISAGGALNEAATEYLTSIINKDGFIGYPDDMKYVFELFIDILGVRIDFVNLYFQSENWITDEMNKKFNSSKIGQLDEFVLEFDNRLPMYRKKPFDFNKLISILLDAINDKMTNNIDINYESIVKNLFLVTRCDFDLTKDNIDKIKYLQETIQSMYNINFVQNDFVDERTSEDGKIMLGR